MEREAIIDILQKGDLDCPDCRNIYEMEADAILALQSPRERAADEMFEALRELLGDDMSDPPSDEYRFDNAHKALAKARDTNG